MPDPDIWLEWHGSRYSAKRGNLICFPVSHVYSFVGGRPNSIAKLNGDPWPEFPPGSSGGSRSSSKGDDLYVLIFLVATSGNS